MKLRNQYTELVEDYKIKNGIDPWVRYKEESCSESEKKEIEDWLFNILRSNGIPRNEVSEEAIIKDLINLSETKTEEVFHDDAYWFNLNGNLTVKEFFFDKMNDVFKDGKPSINQQFNDDHQLMRVVRKSLTYSNNEMSLFNWLQINGSGYGNSFRPATAKAVIEVYGGKGCKVVDSSAGYGARMLGAWSAGASEYVACDPNTYEGCRELSDFLDSRFGLSTKKTVLGIGSEDFPVEDYREYFDLYLCSPPYWSTEKYSKDESQSWVKFKSYEDWIKGFYRQTIYNMCDCLKKDGVFVLNIFEKILNIKKLTSLFLADCGWYIIKNQKYMLRTIPGSNHQFDEEGNPIERDRTIGTNYEAVWVAYHYTRLLKEGLITEEQAKQFKERVTHK